MGTPLIWQPLIKCSLVQAAHEKWVNQDSGGGLSGRWELKNKLGDTEQTWEEHCGWNWVMGPDSEVMLDKNERAAEWDCRNTKGEWGNDGAWCFHF